MAVDKETLQLDLEVVAKTKAFDKLKSVLGETYDQIDNMGKALQLLGSLLGGTMSKKLTPENSKEIETQISQLKVLINLLKDVDTRTGTLNSLKGYKPKTEKLVIPKDNANNNFSEGIQGIVSKKFIERGEKLIEETTFKSEEMIDGMLAEVTRTISDEQSTTLIKFKQAQHDINAKYDPKDFAGKGEIYKTQINPLNGKIIQFTKEIVDGIKYIRKYENGTKVNETQTKEKEKQIKASVRENPDYKAEDFAGQGKIYSTRVNKVTGEITQKTKEIKDNLAISRVYVDGILKSEEKFSKNIEEKPNKFKKFLGRIKNIVLYRLVRVVMSAVTNAFKEGFKSLAVGNNVFNQVITQLKSATLSLKTSLAVMFLPIAQIVANVLKNISSKMIMLANSMSKANAYLNGQSQYFKLNKNAIDKYAKSLTNMNGQLSQLDKFATLSTGTPMLGGMVEMDAKEQEQAVKDAQKLSNTLLTVKGILEGIVGIITIINKGFEKLNGMAQWEKDLLFFGITSGLLLVLTHLKPIMSTVGILTTSIVMIFGIINSDLPPAIKWISSLLYGAALVCSVIFIFTEGIRKNIAGAVAATTFAAATLATINGYRNNMPDNGSVSTPNIGSSTYNMGTNFQFSDAVSTGYAQSNIAQGDVYLDSTKVGKVITSSVYANGVKMNYWGRK